MTVLDAVLRGDCSLTLCIGKRQDDPLSEPLLKEWLKDRCELSS